MAQNGIGSGPVTTFETAADVAEEVAGWLLRQALGTRDHFRLSLSGGSTPKALYQRLAKPPFDTAFPWDRTLLFFGDERYVPKDDPDSNFHMVSEALLRHIDIPPDNIFRIETETSSPQETASRYDATLKRLYGASTFDPVRPLFDVTLLGLGPDGHTASLLPGQPVLEERNAWVAAVSEGRPEARITLTYPALESSRTLAFLVVGADKAAMLAHVRGGATDVPAGRLRPHGAVQWFLDRAAIGA